jgi:hypothetical protein
VAALSVAFGLCGCGSDDALNPEAVATVCACCACNCCVFSTFKVCSLPWSPASLLLAAGSQETYSC